MDAKLECLKEKFNSDLRGITDDTERSIAALRRYYDQVVKRRQPAGVEISFTSTEGNDGGLDGYVIDKRNKKVTLFQCKWYGEPLGTLSATDSEELLGFYLRHLKPDNKDRLNPTVQEFITSYHANFGAWEIELVYLSTYGLNDASIDRYRAEGLKLKVVNQDVLAEEWFEALKREEPVINHGIFVLPKEETIPLDVEFPLDEQGANLAKISVLQCVIRGTDLKRAHIVLKDKLFLKNLRDFAGNTGINVDLKNSAEGPEGKAFYVLHNGISIVAEDFKLINAAEVANEAPQFGLSEAEIATAVTDVAKISAKKAVLLKNYQIVNGAQSTVTIAKLRDDALEAINLPGKITRTKLEPVMERVTVCNNSQNPIDTWDLVSNNEEHLILQNYAAGLTPPVYYQRKTGEKWDNLEVKGITSTVPIKLRTVDNYTAFQAFVAFKGHPGPLYTNTKKILDPDGKVYKQIKNEGDLDTILLAGLLWNYEKSTWSDIKKAKTTRPLFEEYWTNWALATFARVITAKLSKKEREKVKTLLMAANGKDVWNKFRPIISDFYSWLFDNYFPTVGTTNQYQPFFKNDKEAWSLGKFARIPARDIWPLIEDVFRCDTYSEIEAVSKPNGIDLLHFDVNFAIVAKALDEFLSKNSDENLTKIRDIINSY